jgi:hypothetical protein
MTGITKISVANVFRWHKKRVVDFFFKKHDVYLDTMHMGRLWGFYGGEE